MITGPTVVPQWFFVRGTIILDQLTECAVSVPCLIPFTSISSRSLRLNQGTASGPCWVHHEVNGSVSRRWKGCLYSCYKSGSFVRFQKHLVRLFQIEIHSVRRLVSRATCLFSDINTCLKKSTPSFQTGLQSHAGVHHWSLWRIDERERRDSWIHWYRILPTTWNVANDARAEMARLCLGYGTSHREDTKQEAGFQFKF